MRRTRIKICGITRVEDALAAAELGADAVGLVQHRGSVRFVDSQRAWSIANSLPAFVSTVLLYADEPGHRILQAAPHAGTCWVQFHGNEQPADVQEVSPLRVIKAVRADQNLRNSLDKWRAAGPTNLAALVLETPGQFGGSGVTNDWELICTVQEEGCFSGLPPLVLAGGLGTQNVTAVVRRLRPWAVDVSSGVELAPGIKSREKIAAFIDAVREADAP